jgi:hypothetical protein
VIAVLFAAFALRALALWPAAGAELVLDERTYVQRAEALLEGQGFVGSYQSWVRHPGSVLAELPQYPGALQPPGYSVFAASLLAISDRSLMAVRLAQVLLSTLTVWLVYQLGASWFGPRSGLAAAWLCALQPELIAFSHYFWSETLFVCLLLAGVALLARGSEPASRPAAALAGVALGCAALTRSSLVALLPLLLLWLPLVQRAQWRTALARGALAACVAFATIAPWTARNWSVHDGFVLIDTNGAYNLWRGNAEAAFTQRALAALPHYAWPFQAIPVAPVGETSGELLIEELRRETGKPSPSDLEVVAYARSAALASIADEPGRFVARAGYKFVDLWNPTSFFVRHLESGAYGPLPAALESALRFGAFASHLALLALAGLGGWLLRRDPHAWLIAAYALQLTAISLIAFGLTRFRLPLLPFFCLLAGHSLVWLCGRRARAA